MTAKAKPCFGVASNMSGKLSDWLRHVMQASGAGDAKPLQQPSEPQREKSAALEKYCRMAAHETPDSEA